MSWRARACSVAVAVGLAAATLAIGRPGQASTQEETTLRAGPTTVWAHPFPTTFFGGIRVAHLTAGGDPVEGRTVAFYSKDPGTGTLTLRCSGTTRWDGQAHCVSEQAWGGPEHSLDPYVAVFEGDADYLPSSDEGTLVRVLDTDVP